MAKMMTNTTGSDFGKASGRLKKCYFLLFLFNKKNLHF